VALSKRGGSTSPQEIEVGISLDHPYSRLRSAGTTDNGVPPQTERLRASLEPIPVLESKLDSTLENADIRTTLEASGTFPRPPPKRPFTAWTHFDTP
jgi:hypothetical protein